jgi:predicted Rossmann-fold nucleotide-binding protein
MSIRLKRRVLAKTANYTISGARGDAAGTVFTNRGATGAVVFTLPAPNRANTGDYYDFIVVAAFDVKVQGPAADQVVTVGDAVATAVNTAGVGGVMRVLSDGVSWIASGQSVGTTFTVTA